MSAATGTLESNYAVYQSLVARMQLAVRRGRPQLAAALAQHTGAHAWRNHPGLFASPEVEAGLRQLRTQVPSVRSAAGDPIDVLHIVTQTYATGGPTQAIAQWVDRDPARRHNVCLTQQGAAPLPAKIVDRTRQGERLTDLTPLSGGLLERAAALRALVDRSSVVVVHSHPFDVIPTLAIPPARSGVLSINHADHVFWLGTGVPGLHVSMRESGRALSVARRGIAAELTAILPRPLSMPARRLTRVEARRRFGIPDTGRLVITVADAPKYRPVEGPSLLEMVRPVIESDRGAYLLAAGPAPDGEWLEAQRRTDGRIRALGRLPDVSDLHQAADVYLDSFPFSSLTSLLEAASLGAPAVTFKGHPDECAVLGADTPGVDGHLRRPRSAEALRSDLTELLQDENARTAEGAGLAEAVASTHGDGAWLDTVTTLYERAANTGPAGPTEPAEPVCRGVGDLDRMVALVQDKTPLRPGVVGAARIAMPYLPAPARVRVWVAAVAQGEPVAPSFLLPPARLAAFIRWRRSIGLTRSAVGRLHLRRRGGLRWLFP